MMKAKEDGAAPLRTIFWDNDGVLVDTEKLYYEATRDVLARVGVELSIAAFTELSLRQGRSAFEVARQGGFSDAAIEELRARRDRAYTALVSSRVEILPGVEETLRALHGRVAMGVVTSARREHFAAMHRGTGLLRYFEFVLVREDYQQSKPHPDPYLTALASQRIAPQHGLVVEDTERGLLAATGAGLRCVVVPNALTAGSNFASAFRVLDDVRGLVGLVEDLVEQSSTWKS
jgi:HAD superfamily hydrolase (TIGR01509 family)